MTKKSFTLIELIVVIAILAAIIAPNAFTPLETIGKQREDLASLTG